MVKIVFHARRTKKYLKCCFRRVQLNGWGRDKENAPKRTLLIGSTWQMSWRLPGSVGDKCWQLNARKISLLSLLILILKWNSWIRCRGYVRKHGIAGNRNHEIHRRKIEIDVMWRYQETSMWTLFFKQRKSSCAAISCSWRDTLELPVSTRVSSRGHRKYSKGTLGISRCISIKYFQKWSR